MKNHLVQKFTVILIVLISNLFLNNCSKGPKIDVWYGNKQNFGGNGQPQKWINILGRVTSPHGITSLKYSLNDGTERSLSTGPDRRRLARKGDFNIERDYTDFKTGKNKLTITAIDSNSLCSLSEIQVFVHPLQGCPLPYKINWAEIHHIQEVAQIVDGRWDLTEEGVRILEPYYDRVIGLGDLNWRDYEVTVSVVFHGIRIPVKGLDGGAGVIHAAIAVRWPGHDDDNNQPRVKWYPLGATAEFRLTQELTKCSWRILGGGKKVVEENKTRTIQYNIPYRMKHRVETISDSLTKYSVKLWTADQMEPSEWDLQTVEGPDDVKRGGALIIAHYTEVTFGNLEVHPL